MSRRTEAVRKALEWIEQNQAVEHDEPLPADPEHHAGRPWIDDWQTAWAETTLDVIERAWRHTGYRMYRSQGELYDDLRGYLAVKAQEFANGYTPKWSWDDPERAWGAYLWANLTKVARWHFATTIGANNDTNREVHTQIEGRDARIEAMIARSTPAAAMHLEGSISPLAAWRPISPEAYVILLDDAEAALHTDAPEPPAAEAAPLCAEPGCKVTPTRNRHNGLCENHYARHLDMWTEGERCSEPDCPDAARVRGYCQRHYVNEWTRRKKAGIPWEKRPKPTGCSEPGCPNPHEAKGLCNKHYLRLRKQRRETA